MNQHLKFSPPWDTDKIISVPVRLWPRYGEVVSSPSKCGFVGSVWGRPVSTALSKASPPDLSLLGLNNSWVMLNISFSRWSYCFSLSVWLEIPWGPCHPAIANTSASSDTKFSRVVFIKHRVNSLKITNTFTTLGKKFLGSLGLVATLALLPSLPPGFPT